MASLNIEEMVGHYRKVRKAVYEEATRPLRGSTSDHQGNQQRFRDKVTSLCNSANLNRYSGSDPTTVSRLWHLLWARIRYSGGIRAEIATRQVNAIREYFDDFEMFVPPSWDIEVQGHKLVRADKDANSFLRREGKYRDCPGDRTDPSKLHKTVLMARHLSDYLRQKLAGSPVLEFVTGGLPTHDVWGIHRHLMEVGYRGELTALHFMMELGFQVIKPDVVICRLYKDWGWLDKIIPSAATKLTHDLLEKKSNSRSVYRPVIDLARQIVGTADQRELKNDIGWVTENPLREFDIFVVKYGQKPEVEFGVTRTLHR